MAEVSSSQSHGAAVSAPSLGSRPGWLPQSKFCCSHEYFQYKIFSGSAGERPRAISSPLRSLHFVPTLVPSSLPRQEQERCAGVREAATSKEQRLSIQSCRAGRDLCSPPGQPIGRLPSTEPAGQWTAWCHPQGHTGWPGGARVMELKTEQKGCVRKVIVWGHRWTLGQHGFEAAWVQLHTGFFDKYSAWHYVVCGWLKLWIRRADCKAIPKLVTAQMVGAPPLPRWRVSWTLL